MLPTVPATIREQIGAGVLMSCGARDFVYDDRSLSFRVGTRGKVCRVKVTLTPADLYEVKYVAISRTFKITHDETVDHVGAESLASVVRRLGDRERY